MGRPKQIYETMQMRASIRSTIDRAVYDTLAKDNYFNPLKPAQGDYSKLVETLLRKWLATKLSPQDMNKLDRCKTLDDYIDAFGTFEDDAA